MGAALGRNSAAGACLAAIACPVLQSVVSTVQAVAVYTLAPHIGKVFTTDVDIIHVTTGLLRILSVYVFADGLQCALTGVLKGVGKQRICGPIVVTCYFAVALPLAYMLAFRWDYVEGAPGLAIGTTLGTWLHLLSYCALLYGINWNTEAAAAQDHLKHTQSLQLCRAASGKDNGSAASCTSKSDSNIDVEEVEGDFEQIPIGTSSEVKVSSEKWEIPSVDAILKTMAESTSDFTSWRKREYELVRQHGVRGE